MSIPKLSSATSRVWLLDRDPSNSEEVSIEFGNFWINTNSNDLFECTRGVPQALTWMKRAASSGKNVFAPLVIGSTSNGTASYNTQLGVYEKIGNQVFVSINLQWNSHTGSGNLLISGMPLPASQDLIFASTVNLQNIVLPLGSLTTIAQTTQNGLSILATIAGSVNVPVVLSTSGSLRLTMNYMV